jgi:hypothetical protein
LVHGIAVSTWRKTLGFDGEDLSFPEVHDRYRQLMLSWDPVDMDRLKALNTALEAARLELGTSRPKRPPR